MKMIVCKRVQYPRMDGVLQMDRPVVKRERQVVTEAYFERYNYCGEPNGKQLIEDKEATKQYAIDIIKQKEESKQRRVTEQAFHKDALLAAISGNVPNTSKEDKEKDDEIAALKAKLEEQEIEKEILNESTKRK